MKLFPRLMASTLCAFSGYAALASAQEASQHPHEHAAHVHGHAKLELTLDEQTLLIQLHAPAADLLGFEHAPITDAEKTQYQRVQVLLGQSSTLFTLSDEAGCQSSSVTLKGMENDHPSIPTGEHAEHMDIDASYLFHCQQPQALHRVQLALFHHFPSLQEVAYQTISSAGQSAGELTPEQPQLQLEEKP